MNRFLTRCASAPISGSHAVHVVMGNESADLDSIASSAVYAYLKTEAAKASDTADVDGLFVPVINIPRAEWKFRPDAELLFRKAGIDPTSLMFRNEIDLSGLHKEQRLRLHLVDHNRLCMQQEVLEDAVVEIVDHHVDEHRSKQVEGGARVIELVGSAASLIGNSFETVPADAATLLLGPILIDTANLDPSMKKATPKDEDVAAKMLTASGVARAEFFEALSSAKWDVSMLNTTELLTKDCKSWRMGQHVVGISSVVAPLASLAQRDSDPLAQLRAFAETKGFDVMIVMTAFKADGVFRREVAASTTMEPVLQQLDKCLQESQYRFVPIEVSCLRSEQVLCFEQQDTVASRKQIQPMLAALFSR